MDVGVVGGGVVGTGVALALARRGAGVVLWEAERALGLAASGTNSGILTTGFDTPPGSLETALLRRAARLRPAVLAALGVRVLARGARMRAGSAGERAALGAVARTAAANGVDVALEEDELRIPGEAVCDPVRCVAALAAAAVAHGADVRLGAPVEALRPARGPRSIVVGTPDGDVRCDAVVNCAGLGADAVAALAGDGGWRIHPRKGEFLVFAPAAPLPEIIVPVPAAGTRGVLVVPTVDGMVLAGPTAVDATDKRDWRVRPEAAEEIRAAARRLHPELDDAEPVAAYAGLRPAGDGPDYVVARSRGLPGLLHVAAIRSTGLSASLGIAEHVCELLGLGGEPEAPLRPGSPPPAGAPWWRRAAERSAAG